MLVFGHLLKYNLHLWVQELLICTAIKCYNTPFIYLLITNCEIKTWWKYLTISTGLVMYITRLKNKFLHALLFLRSQIWLGNGISWESTPSEWLVFRVYYFDSNWFSVDATLFRIKVTPKSESLWLGMELIPSWRHSESKSKIWLRRSKSVWLWYYYSLPYFVNFSHKENIEVKFNLVTYTEMTH